MNKRGLMTAWAAAGLLAAPGAALAADAAHPAVVEEFQSQGCNSCPPANANLNAIAGRPGVLALSFSVTYWDRLGWKDTFARPAYTERQWDYAGAGGRDTVYTPQMIVNGTGVLVGTRAAELEAALKRYDRGDGGPEIGWSGGRVSVSGSAPEGAAGGEASVWLVRYDPRLLKVHVGAGENRGRVLPHRNVVKELSRLGRWTGGPQSYPLPASPDSALRTAVLVQRGPGGPILAAARMP